MVWTVGHSTRSLDELLVLLHAQGVRGVLDVRRYPHSRRHPHFDTAALARDLPVAGVAYRHAPGLGGFRRARHGSPNTAVEPAFRGYADYMLTDEFARELDALTAAAGATPTAIMCAEAKPSQCHRSFISDALLAAGVTVRHILTLESAETHTLRPEARVINGRVTYPGEPELFGG